MAAPPEPPRRRPRGGQAAPLVRRARGLQATPLRALPPLVLAGGLLLTALTLVAAHRSALEQRRALERSLLAEADQAISATLEEEIGQLRAVGGLVQAAGPVGESELSTFLGALGAGDRALAFVRRVEATAHPAVREAAERAARTGQPTLSAGRPEAVLMLPVGGTQPGEGLIGWVLAPVDTEALLARALARLKEGDWLQQHLRVAAAVPGGGESGRTVAIAGRTWILSLEERDLAAFTDYLDHRLWLLLAGGVGASVLAALSTRALVNSHLTMRAALAVSRAAGEERALASTVFEASRLGIVVSDPQGRIVMVNEAFSRLSGYRPVEVLGRQTNLLRSGRHDASFYRELWNSLFTRGHWQGDLWNRVRSGELRRHHLSISTVRGADQRPRYFVGMLEDITDRYAQERAVLHEARHDVLTGLGNRSLLIEQLKRDLALARRHGWAVALLYLDLDGFKRVNDRHGHATGDRVLQVIGRRLHSVLRQTDLLCRQGGDEFVVLVPHAGGVEELRQIAGKLIAATEAPFPELDLRPALSASVGIARYPDHGRNAEELLAAADRAMYAAKARSGGCALLATPMAS